MLPITYAIEELAMPLIAHATMPEFAAGIVVFLTGVCVGPWVAT
jgi:hypothetical protein